MINGHGDDLYRYTTPITSNFSSNVFCGIDHSVLFQRLADALPRLCSYPEPEPASLESALAAFFRVPADSVCFTNGATEAIYLIAQAFRGRKSAVWMPTFSEYADACRLHGHRVSSFYTYEGLPSDADIAWLCNPNNPTGEARNHARLRDWITSHPHTLFVIDQSYEAFTLKRLFSIEEASRMPNVVLIHSLTKHFAIPGLRAGYLTACAEVMRLIRAQRMPWSVNALAVEAGFYALDEKFALPFDLEAYLRLKDEFADDWRRTGLADVWDSDTHFFLLRLRSGKASALKDFLARRHGILIRDASNFEGLDAACFRLATQRREENRALIGAFMEWMAEP